jgi:16S rRNA (cytosine967-C5)-methyltransferase
MPSTEGLPARRAALQMLDAILRRGRTLDAAAVQAGKGLKPEDQGLAMAIAGEVLRRLPDLDALIDSATRQRLPDDSKARMVLRAALAQRIGLGTAEHAVVATALPLVEGGPRRLVHGVLGTLLRRGLPAIDAPHLPHAVELRWSAAWGNDMVEAARRQIARRPMLDLSFRGEEEARSFIAETGGLSLAPGHARLQHSGAVAELPGFNDGLWWVQDLAASLPARLIPKRAREVLDLCAAPGGKTMQIAASGHAVTAVDQSELRLRRLRENLDRTGLTARLVAADALTWQVTKPFDAILLDAPCSATGTYRRHPEVLYRARPQIIRQSAELQRQLLTRAAAWLSPGGMIVYSVCSLEPDEGEAVISSFLEDHPSFETSPPEPGELPGFVTPTPEGWVRILPGLLEDKGGLDGFFLARLVRTAT